MTCCANCSGTAIPALTRTRPRAVGRTAAALLRRPPGRNHRGRRRPVCYYGAVDRCQGGRESRPGLRAPGTRGRRGDRLRPLRRFPGATPQRYLFDGGGRLNRACRSPRLARWRQAFERSPAKARLVSWGGIRVPGLGSRQRLGSFPWYLPGFLRPGWRTGLRLIPSRRVSLRRCVGSRNRPLAALAPGGQRSFPAAGIPGGGFAGADFLARWETSWPPGPAGVRAPPSRRWHLTAGKGPAVPRLLGSGCLPVTDHV